jgi:hypothetical protein
MRAAFSYPGSGLFLVGGDILPQSLHWGGHLTGEAHLPAPFDKREALCLVSREAIVWGHVIQQP